MTPGRPPASVAVSQSVVSELSLKPLRGASWLLAGLEVTEAQMWMGLHFLEQTGMEILNWNQKK